jgi:hypothetical protein
METKTCSKCGLEKPLEEFYTQRKCCKSCWSILRKTYYSQKREEAKQWRNSYHIKHRESENKYGHDWYARNKLKAKITSAKWYFDNLDKAKANHLRNKFGITVEEYNKLLLEQDGKCAICGKSQAEFNRSFCVDHDHNTGKVRGLLCDNCNKALGCFYDDINIIKAAYNYIEKRMQTIPVFFLANKNYPILKPAKTGKEG